MITEEIKKKYLSAIDDHPLAKEAIGWKYCVNDVFSHSKKILQRIPLPEAEKSVIFNKLSNTEEVIHLSFLTSDREPAPLSGAGKTYDFFFNPITDELLWTGVGTWRS